MSDRQTPEQIADGHSQHFARLSLLTQLAEHGYVIVHTDDMPVNPWLDGRDDCSECGGWDPDGDLIGCVHCDGTGYEPAAEQETP